jgi:predicted nucleic acid-binding protein
MSRKVRVSTSRRCVLDSGGLTALLGRSQRSRAWFRWVVEHEGDVILPTAVLVETVTGDGARDAEVNRVVNILAEVGRLLASDESLCRLAGRLRYRASTDDGIDALVAAVAAAEAVPTVVLTSDPVDLSRLLVECPGVTVITV